MKPETAKPKILVVDDDAFVREFHALALIRVGYSVTWASNGVEAMGWLSRHQFDAVVSDIAMPEMDGLRLLQAIHYRFPSLPVILVSGTVHSEMEELARAWGAVAVLAKPVNIEKLRVLVEGACSEDNSAAWSNDTPVTEGEQLCAAAQP